MSSADPLVYRGFTKAALDAQYNIRGMIANAADVLADWSRRGALTRARLRVTKDIKSGDIKSGGIQYGDIAYGTAAMQDYDVYHGVGAGPRPCLMFVHGGYWQALSKVDCAFLAEAFVARGVSVVMVNYRLCPGVSMSDVVEDCRACVAHVAANAAGHNIDAGRLFVAGNSAGGHLTAVLLSTDWSAFGLPRDLVKGGCAISGLYDLEPIRLTYLNDKLGMNADDARRLSPLHMLPRRAGHLILSVGGDESAEFHRQQADYLAAWQARGLPCSVVPQTRGDHFQVMEWLGDPAQPLFHAVMTMIEA